MASPDCFQAVPSTPWPKRRLRLVYISILDLGSNSFQWLVAETDGRRVQTRYQCKRHVRLASSMEHGALSAEGLARALEAVSELSSSLPALWRPLPVVAVATGAIRQSSNGGQLLRAIEVATGIGVQMISGEREAQLAYLGALSDRSESFSHGSDSRVAVIDLGGGSLEAAVGQGIHPQQAYSTPRGLLTAARRVSELCAAGYSAPAALEEAARWVVCGLGERVETESVLAENWVAACGVARELHQLLRQLRLLPTPTTPLVPALLEAHWPRWASWAPGRLRELGVSADRCATLPLAAGIFAILCRHFGVQRLAVSQGGLRQGLALDCHWRRHRRDRGVTALPSALAGGSLSPDA